VLLYFCTTIDFNRRFHAAVDERLRHIVGRVISAKAMTVDLVPEAFNSVGG
jgi:hypothetical protein